MHNPFGFSLEPSPSTCRIERLLICEVHAQNNQYLRPYTVDSSYDVVRQLENVIVQPGNVTPQALATVPNGFLAPSATPHSLVNIVNGWDSRRFRFMMVVVFESNLTTSREIICGYTDHPGITAMGNHLDPNMVFYINSVVPMIRRVSSTQYGNIEQFLPSTPSHMIGLDQFGEVKRGSRLHLMTPQSVLNQMVTNTLDYGNSVHDMSSDVNTASFSSRDNTNSLRYASKLFTNYKDEVISDMQSPVGMSERELLSKVRGMSFEKLSTGTDQFINVINGVSGDGNRTWFQLKELLRVDPNVLNSQVTQVVMLENRTIPIEYTQHVSGSDITTQMAVNISNVLPTIMLDYGLVKMSLSSTNNLIGGQIQTFITDMRSLSGSSYDLSHIVQPIINRINSELIPIISINNQVVYDIDIICELTGETTIMLSIENQEKIPFIVPTFADTLFNPIITDNKEQMNHVVNGIYNMFTTINSWIDSQPKHYDFNNTIPYRPNVLNDL